MLQYSCYNCTEKQMASFETKDGFYQSQYNDPNYAQGQQGYGNAQEGLVGFVVQYQFVLTLALNKLFRFSKKKTLFQAILDYLLLLF